MVQRLIEDMHLISTNECYLGVNVSLMYNPNAESMPELECRS